jgi:3'(2'), 5'-bisphosphate nucleotidase
MLGKVLCFCREAGAEILRLYAGETEVTYKEDRSPLTAADRASHELLVRRLGCLTPAIPVISEESPSHPDPAAALNGQFWLVDPLDGTKEFLKRNGNFTVNVALVRNGQPVLGVVFAPVSDVAYFAQRGSGAWRRESRAEAVPIHTRPAVADRLRIVASKDHAGPEVKALLGRFPTAEITSIGSSLKFCMVAEGAADFYPRFVGTMEWDTAAAQCVVEEAGGRVLTLDGAPLCYGKRNWRNPSILTIGDPIFDWRKAVTSVL